MVPAPRVGVVGCMWLLHSDSQRWGRSWKMNVSSRESHARARAAVDGPRRFMVKAACNLFSARSGAHAPPVILPSLGIRCKVISMAALHKLRRGPLSRRRCACAFLACRELNLSLNARRRPPATARRRAPAKICCCRGRAGSAGSARGDMTVCFLLCPRARSRAARSCSQWTV